MSGWLLEGSLVPLEWADVEGWMDLGGAELGTSRMVPTTTEFAAVSAVLQQHGVEAVLMIGGSKGYQACHELLQVRDSYPGLRVPLICLPATAAARAIIRLAAAAGCRPT